jgi:hypothetical protein
MPALSMLGKVGSTMGRGALNVMEHYGQPPQQNTFGFIQHPISAIRREFMPAQEQQPAPGGGPQQPFTPPRTTPLFGPRQNNRMTFGLKE